MIKDMAPQVIEDPVVKVFVSLPSLPSPPAPLHVSHCFASGSFGAHWTHTGTDLVSELKASLVLCGEKFSWLPKLAPGRSQEEGGLYSCEQEQEKGEMQRRGTVFCLSCDQTLLPMKLQAQSEQKG